MLEAGGSSLPARPATDPPVYPKTGQGDEHTDNSKDSPRCKTALMQTTRTVKNSFAEGRPALQQFFWRLQEFLPLKNKECFRPLT